jgi:hypothetical protein
MNLMDLFTAIKVSTRTYYASSTDTPSPPRHEGDLENIMADESGKAVFNITAPNLKLEKVISRFVTVRLIWGGTTGSQSIKVLRDSVNRFVFSGFYI